MNIKVIVGIGVFIFIVGVVFILDSQGYFLEDEIEEEEEEVVIVDVGDSYYVPLPRPLVFNLMSGDRVRTVQINVQLMVTGAKNERIALSNLPLIENALLNAFSEADYDEIITQAGKDELNVDALRAVQVVFRKLEGKKVIEQILFTGFIIQ
jgi:flagellar FliL protein